MTKCGKSWMPECEYFTTGGCISPFNCVYKIEEHNQNTVFTSGDTNALSGIEKFFIKTVKSGVLPQAPMNYDGAAMKVYISYLESENAALRERLEKAVELPCKVGDTIFYVQYFCDYKGCDSTTQQFCCGCKEMIEREKHKEKYVICEKSFVLKDLEKIGKKYFTTREAAEARLAELKGGKE